MCFRHSSALRGGMFDRIAVDVSDEARLIADVVAEPLARGDRAAAARRPVHS